jgi:hypothetical protein
MADASADAQRMGRKRRFSLPDNGGVLGAGIPLTAFLPSEFKRRRTTATAPSSPQSFVSPTSSSMEGSHVIAQTPTLPRISELVQGAAMLVPASAAQASLSSHPEPCLPPHTAATPDHPRFAPSVAAPAPFQEQLEHHTQPLQQTQTVIMPQQQVMMTMAHGPVDVASSQTAFMYGNPGSSSSSPSSSMPSSPRLGDTPASDLQQARDDAQADKARRAERVAEILDLMDRQNNGGCAVDASTAALAAAADASEQHQTSIESWPAGASDAAKRRRVGKDQTGILDLMFKVEPMPSQATKKRLADGLGMTYKQVQIWFQNKRARCKRAVEAPPRSSHTFHNVLVSHDGRFMMKELAKAQQRAQQNDQSSSANHLYEHHISSHHEPSAAPPVALRSCILTQ